MAQTVADLETGLVTLQRRISRADRLRAFSCRSAFHWGSMTVGSQTVRPVAQAGQ